MTQPNGTVYTATNIITGEIYVGASTHSLSRRMAQHISKSRYSTTKFHKAIQLYGKENFAWTELHKTDDIHELERLEKSYIAYYTEQGFKLYNKQSTSKITLVNQGEKHPNYGLKRPEVNKKISETKKRA